MQTVQDKKSNSEALILLLMAIAAAAITVTGIIFKQSFVRILPLYVSLIISLMQSRVSKYAMLLGGINSILYGFTYWYYHLYASMMYAVLVSCPMQIISFILWSKKPWNESTILKKLSIKQRAVITAVSIACWAAACIFLQETGARYRMLDTAITIIGIISTVLMMLSYVEYSALLPVSQACSIVLYILMLKEQPEQSTYLAYSIYSIVCSLTAFSNAHKIYDCQQIEKSERYGGAKGETAI